MPEMIADNIRFVTQRIAKCCDKIGRSPDSVQLVCVTKEASVDEMKQAADAGAKVFGENRVQDALAKYRAIGDIAEWHLIGHLQTNKVKDVVGVFSLIHSVDSLRLVKAIDVEASRIGAPQKILVQVNISGEASKFGIKPEDAISFLKETALYPNIIVKGLMTIAPEVEDPEAVRPYFRALKELLGEINAALSTKYETLSMGMTDDFEIAIEEGSNIVRIGRAIFK